MCLSEVLSLILTGNLYCGDESVMRQHLDVVGSEHHGVITTMHTTEIYAALLKLRKVQQVSKVLDLQACREVVLENSSLYNDQKTWPCLLVTSQAIIF